MLNPEGVIPESCPVFREKYGERLAKIEERLIMLHEDIRRARVDKYIFGVICSMCSGAFASLITYVIK